MKSPEKPAHDDDDLPVIPPPLDIPPRADSNETRCSTFERTRAVFTKSKSNPGTRQIDHEPGFSPPRRKLRTGSMIKSQSVPAALSKVSLKMQNKLPAPDSTNWSPSSLAATKATGAVHNNIPVNEEDSNGTIYTPSIAASSTGASSMFGKLRLESPMEVSDMEETDTVVLQSQATELMSIVEQSEDDVISCSNVPPNEVADEVSEANVPDEEVVPDMKTSPVSSSDTTPAEEDDGLNSNKKTGLINSPVSNSSASSSPATAVSSSQSSSTPTKKRSPLPPTEFTSPFDNQKRTMVDTDHDITSPRHGLPKAANNYAVVPRVAQPRRTLNRRPLGDLSMNLLNFVETRSFSTRTLTLGRESQLYRERGGKFTTCQ